MSFLDVILHYQHCVSRAWDLVLFTLVLLYCCLNFQMLFSIQHNQNADPVPCHVLIAYYLLWLFIFLFFSFLFFVVPHVFARDKNVDSVPCHVSHDYLFCIFFLVCLRAFACMGGRTCVCQVVRVAECVRQFSRVRACACVCSRARFLFFQACLSLALLLKLGVAHKMAIISWVLLSSGRSDWKNCCSRPVYCFWGFRSCPTLSSPTFSGNERFKGDCGYKQRRRCTDISGDAISFSLSVLLRFLRRWQVYWVSKCCLLKSLQNWFMMYQVIQG